jgi:hypothetical protein
LKSIKEIADEVEYAPGEERPPPQEEPVNIAAPPSQKLSEEL